MSDENLEQFFTEAAKEAGEDISLLTESSNEFEEIKEEKQQDDPLALLTLELKKRDEDIAKLTSLMDEMKQSFSTQQNTSKQQSTEQVLNELEQQRLNAISEGNLNLVQQIEQEQLKLRNVIHPQVDPAIQGFTDRNKWYGDHLNFEHSEMTQWVDNKADQLAKLNLPLNKTMSILEEHVQKKFPEYFGGKDDNKPPSVESTTSIEPSVNKGKKYSFNSLPQEHKKFALEFESKGIMTRDEYVQELMKDQAYVNEYVNRR